MSKPLNISEISPGANFEFAEEAIRWLEDPDGGAISLRPWQRIALMWGLAEVDGRFVFRTPTILTPRQAGKGYLILSLALIRCEFASRFGEPQEVVHVANNLAAAQRIHRRMWRWAEAHGLRIYKANGNERMVWPDGSHWSLVAERAIWGWSGTMALLDEAWNVAPEVLTSALEPTLVERNRPQLWVFTTANEDATPLVPDLRRRERAGRGSVGVLEWGPGPGADLGSEAVWEASTPFWSAQRLEFMREASKQRGFRYQWLNDWSPFDAEDGAHWLPGWGSCKPASGRSAGGMAAVEVAQDRSLYGAAYAVARPDGSLDVWTYSGADLEGVLAWLSERDPREVVVGMSLRPAVEAEAEWPVVEAGWKVTALATPTLPDLVRRGKIRHDHSAIAAEQVSWSVASDHEGGPVLSARKSRGPIPLVKAVAWATWAATSRPAEEPAVL